MGIALGLATVCGSLFLSSGSVDLTWAASNPQLFFIAVLVSPLLEEWFFRGWLWLRIEQSNWPSQEPRLFRTNFSKKIGLTSTNITVTIAFAVMHLVFRDPLTALMVVLPSIYLGFVRTTWGGWFPGFTLHAFWNFLWFSSPIFHF
jgi:membrane protease YdiL (CAAX protease family)